MHNAYAIYDKNVRSMLLANSNMGLSPNLKTDNKTDLGLT